MENKIASQEIFNRKNTIEKAAEQFTRILIAQIEWEAKTQQQSKTADSMAGSDKTASKEDKSEPTHIT